MYLVTKNCLSTKNEGMSSQVESEHVFTCLRFTLLVSQQLCSAPVVSGAASSGTSELKPVISSAIGQEAGQLSKQYFRANFLSSSAEHLQ